VQEQLALGIVGISPMRLKEWYREHDPKGQSDYQWLKDKDAAQYTLTADPRAIAQRDLYDVQRADMIFAYLPREMNEQRPSWGTAFELGAAWGRKPVVIVTDDPALSGHPLAQAIAGWIVPDLEQGVNVVNSVLEVYT
jgi:nucleoside 2-deoxyribosyltransferase